MKAVRKVSSNTDDVHHESEDSPTSEVFENVPTQNIHLGTQSEITDLSVEATIEGTRTEITDMSNITFNSETPITRATPGQSRFELYDTSRTPMSRRSRSSRRTTFSLNAGFINPPGAFSQNLKDRGRFVLELFKLNYRMLISLTLTLFVAIFVPPLVSVADCRSLSIRFCFRNQFIIFLILVKRL